MVRHVRSLSLLTSITCISSADNCNNNSFLEKEAPNSLHAPLKKRLTTEKITMAAIVQDIRHWLLYLTIESQKLVLSEWSWCQIIQFWICRIEFWTVNSLSSFLVHFWWIKLCTVKCFIINCVVIIIKFANVLWDHSAYLHLLVLFQIAANHNDLLDAVDWLYCYTHDWFSVGHSLI